MKFKMPISITDIAKLIDAKVIGDANIKVSFLSEIHKVEKGSLMFVDNEKYYNQAVYSTATAIIINKELDCPEGKVLLISDDPFRDFNKLTQHFKPFQASNTAISNSAVIGKNTVIQPNCFIGNNVVIGDNCIIHSNVSIYDDTIIGDNVIIHAGTILGSSAFYYKNRPEGFDQLKSGGRVVIENNVHLGAACTIDKGVTGDTRIKEDTKIDNQVQIGHDTVIGKKCLIASQVGIAGCVIIEDEVTIWGQVGITSAITIGEKAVISAKSGVSKSLEGGKSYFGIPADDFRSKYKEIASIRKIPEILEILKKQEK